MIHKRADLHALRQLLDSADVIAVIVRDHQIVDALEVSQFRRRDDAAGISSIEPRPARIHQHRLPRRRDDQRRLAAFDIDGIDLQGLGFSLGRHARHQ